jgi:hypothetical protein
LDYFQKPKTYFTIDVDGETYYRSQPLFEKTAIQMAKDLCKKFPGSKVEIRRAENIDEYPQPYAFDCGCNE